MTISLAYAHTVMTQNIYIMSFLTLRPITYIDGTRKPHCFIEVQITGSIKDTCEFQDNCSYFSMKTYVMTPRLNRLNEMVLIMDNNMF